MNALLKRLLTASVGLAVALVAGLTLSAQPAAARTGQHADEPSISACRFAAYPPKKEGSILRAWGEKWDCGAGTAWTITLQRHRGGAWWQNEGVNYHTGDDWVSVTAGCVSGQRTYRTILQSNLGHQMVSAHATITC